MNENIFSLLWRTQDRLRPTSNPRTLIIGGGQINFSGLGVVISQTHRLVSQERLSPKAGTSVFIDLIPIMPSGEQWF